ncbi:hypothetical protein Q5752_006516 [Cryptotrichosporon argae]
MRAFALLPLLPLIAAFRLPSPQNALAAAADLLDTGAAAHSFLSPASDFTLASIPGDEHVVVTSASHPNHKIRIKSTTGWCDPGVRSYSGYLDVGYGKELFFYFFESRHKPAEDPVVMWINGGPGCSSALGLFMELGPCTVKNEPKSVNDTEYNPYSWNEKANIFFLDEPIGVGFSHAEHGQVVGTAEKAARDVQAFVSIFFDNFKEFKGRAFHMAGESYGGRYLPLFASAVYDGNRELVKKGKEPINLQSVMIGNGITDFFTTMVSYYPYQCTIHGGLNRTVQSIGACIDMAEAVPKCHKLARKGCIESKDYTECSIAINYCQEMLGSSFEWAGVNPYDVSKPCTRKELSESLCYSETKKIGEYLNLPEVRSLLGVHGKKDWGSCDGGVFRAFTASLDSVGQTWLYVAALLERGVRILNYAGTLDFICNHIANEMWMDRLEWSGQSAYQAAALVDWHVDGELAGSYKTSGNLTLLKVLGAGHMVPTDQPKNILSAVSAWLDAAALSE